VPPPGKEKWTSPEEETVSVIKGVQQGVIGLAARSARGSKRFNPDAWRH